MLKNQKEFICMDMMDLIIKKAADDLFNTPVVSEVPSDSFDDFIPAGMNYDDMSSAIN